MADLLAGITDIGVVKVIGAIIFFIIVGATLKAMGFGGGHSGGNNSNNSHSNNNNNNNNTNG